VVKVQEEDTLPIWPISLTIATAALGAGTLAVGLTELGAENELTDLTRKIPANKKAIENQRDKAQKLSIVTDVLGGTTLLAAVATAWLWVRETREPDDKTTATTTSAWRPQLGWASVGVEGKF
jgi:hypothetical protein